MKTLTLIVLVLASFIAEGQRLKVRLTLKTGETSDGYIADTRDDWTKETIAFSNSPTDALKDIPITDIKELYVEAFQATYQGEMVDRDTKSVELNTLEDNGQIHMVKEFILLERLAQGPLTLFKYKDNKAKVHYFIQKEGQPIETLLFVRYIKMPEQLLVERPMYVTRLEQIKKECPAMKAKIPELEEAALMKFVSSYNSCVTGTAEVKTKKVNTVPTSFGLRGGLAFGSGKFEGRDNFRTPLSGTDLSNGSYARPMTALGEFAVELGMKRSTVRSRIAFYAAYYQSGELTHSSELGVYDYDYKISFNMLGFGIRYTYLLTATTVKPFLRGSFEGGAIMSPHAVRTRTDTSTGIVTTADITSLRGFGYGLTAGTGVRFKGFEVEARIHGFVAPSEGNPSQTTVISPEVILGYYLRQ